jgi:micrococcal nuclease
MRRPTLHLLPTWPVIGLVLLCVVLAARSRTTPLPPGSTLPAPQETHRVARVIDGDTLLLGNGIRVRLLGVDTPETNHPDRPVEPWGLEAKAFTQQLVEGRDVRLEYDRERLDQYRRVLAYVWIEDRLLNEELIRHGLSAAETGFPIRSDRQRRFRNAEEAARAEQMGIWSPSELSNSNARAPGLSDP